MKVVITARNFSAGESRGLEILAAAGLEIINAEGGNWGTGASDEELRRTIAGADFVIAGLEPFNAETIAACPELKLISRRGIGYDAVDLAACRRHGVTLARTLGAVEGAVAEHVLAYILYFAKCIGRQNEAMQRGEWTRIMAAGAKSRRLGLVGFGGIGKEIARRAVPFGMEVSYYCRHPRAEWDAQYGVSYQPLDELLAQSDYVSVNVPLTAETEKLFDAAAFAKMKQGSIFINIARAKVMDEKALRAAVDSGHLGGAAVDVFLKEPCTDSALHGSDKIILTPHTAPFTAENFALMNNIAAQNVVDFVRGELEEKYIVR